MSREIGNEAEDRAVVSIVNDGYTVIERNYNCRVGEIDIIANKDGYICFIEVKYRNARGFGSAVDAITKSKMRKILATARRYLYENDKSDVDYRIDAVVIDGEKVEIMPNVYTAGMN